MTNVLYWFVLGSGTIGFLICVMFSKYFARTGRKYDPDKSPVWTFNSLGFMLVNTFAVAISGWAFWILQGVLRVKTYDAPNDQYGITEFFTSIFFALSSSNILLASINAFIYRKLAPKLEERISTGPLKDWGVMLRIASAVLVLVTVAAVASEKLSAHVQQQDQVDRKKLLHLVVTSFEKEFKTAKRTPCPDPRSNSYNFPMVCYPVDDTAIIIGTTVNRALHEQAVQPGNWKVVAWYSSADYELKEWPRFRVVASYYPKTDQWLGSEKDGEYWGPYRPHKALLKIFVQ